MRSKLNGLGLGEVQLQEFGAPNHVLIRVERQSPSASAGGEEKEAAAVRHVKQALGLPDSSIERREFVGPKVGEELIRAGVIATVLALLSIAIYVWFRFEWQFGIAALITLLHDVLATVGVFSLFHLEFNLTTVAAILTIAGYSINDTVVVFDRVRENMRKYKAMPLYELHNLSVNETLSRTILTIDDHAARRPHAVPVRRRGDPRLHVRHAVRDHRRHLLIDLHRVRHAALHGRPNGRARS